jgi:uncharacterized protein (DUF2345 family)
MLPVAADEYTEFYILKANNKALPNVACHLVLEGSKEIGGTTDKDGKTLLVVEPGTRVVQVRFDQGFPVEIA